ncbi:hypothetical protein H4Q26_006903 [Puccinia striiformis f. sp. tritici PST-130]|nr:hypothetical protein H4Q26_006903 [Puccinia striiformis f. sp. tritici PST-130]
MKSRLSVSDAFRACTSPVKINLGVGAYRDKEGKPFVLSSVCKAQAAVVAAKYNEDVGLPLYDQGFCDGTAKLERNRMYIQQGVELLSKALKIGHPLGILSELDKASLHGGTICAADQADRLFLMTNIEAFPSRADPASKASNTAWQDGRTNSAQLAIRLVISQLDQWGPPLFGLIELSILEIHFIVSNPDVFEQDTVVEQLQTDKKTELGFSTLSTARWEQLKNQDGSRSVGDDCCVVTESQILEFYKLGQ